MSNLSIGKHDIIVPGGKLRFSIEAYKGFPEKIYIHGIEVKEPYRGLGIGTRLLNEIIDLSNKSNLPIELFAEPIRDSSMTKDELIDWYKSKGFEEVGGSLMVYVP